MNNTQDNHSKTALVFVYGSLKRGHNLHSEIADQQFIGPALSSAEYQLFDCGSYPAMVKVTANGYSIRGELYRVDDSCLSRLDVVEGVNEGLYVREPVNLQEPEACGTTNPVWAWFYLRDISGLKECGCEWP